VSYAEAEHLYLDFLTAHDLLYFVAKARQAPDEGWKELVQQFQMEAFLDQACSAYSSGMLTNTGYGVDRKSVSHSFIRTLYHT
jgi:ABC-2 type transport system ATP-binding protein